MTDQWWIRLNEHNMTARTREGHWVGLNYQECPSCHGYSNDDSPCDECECRGVVIVPDTSESVAYSP